MCYNLATPSGRSKEKLRLQEGIDDHAQARHLLEADLKVTTEQFHEYKRQAQQRETDYSTRVHASALGSAATHLDSLPKCIQTGPHTFRKALAIAS